MTGHPNPIYRPRKHGPKGGGVLYPDPTGAFLDAIVDLVADCGYRELTLRRLTKQAGIPREIFAQLFDDLEDSFLAASDRALADLTRAIAPEYLDLQAEWPHRVHRTLAALLLYCDEHPKAANLLFLQSLTAGPRAARRRAEILSSAANRLHTDAPHLDQPSTPSSFVAEFVIQAVTEILYARIFEPTAEPRADLLNHLATTLLLPYLGQEATAQHLKTQKTSQNTSENIRSRSAPLLTHTDDAKPTSQSSPALPQTPFMLTGRMLMVLRAVAENPGASNRPIANAAGIADGGQASKLLNRLEGIRWLNKTPPEPGEANAWWITAEGTAVLEVPIEHVSDNAT